MSHQRAIGLTVLLLGAVGFTVDADSGGQAPIKWLAPHQVSVVLVSGCTDQNDGSDRMAVANALASWSGIDACAFAFEQVDNPADAAVEIDFVSQDWPGALEGALGVATRDRSIEQPVHYTAASIRINDQDFEFGTAGQFNIYDIETVIVHELGHVLGLEHSAQPAATMNFKGRAGSTYFRSLHADDRAGARFLYPATGFSCSGDEQCPTLVFDRGLAMETQRCDGGPCVAGAAGFGHDCYLGADCASGLCVFDPEVLGAPATVPNPGFCTIGCGTQSCPASSWCSDVLGLPGGPVCFVGHEDCAEDVECHAVLGANGICDTDLDGIYRCQLLCEETNDCGAVPGSFCHGSEPGAHLGRCRVPGSRGQGMSCDNALQCESLLCGGGPTPQCCNGNDCEPDPSHNDGGPTEPEPDDPVSSQRIEGGCRQMGGGGGVAWVCSAVCLGVMPLQRRRSRRIARRHRR